MTKIKIVGVFVFTLSIILIVLFSYISNQNKVNSNLLNNINIQKAFTQDISKNIFYIYKNKNTSKKYLDENIQKFLNQVNYTNQNFSEISCLKIDEQNKKIAKLWNKFYLSVDTFRKQSRVMTPYSNILLERTVKDIYNKNLMLIIEFDKLIKIHKSYFDNKLDTYKTILYALFLLLVVLLIYLFTQIKIILSFIQKFLHTSKHILKKSTIKDLEHIEVKNTTNDVLEATNNFNILVDNINNSILQSSSSIEHSYKSLEFLEDNIEDMLELINEMDNNDNIDKELTKKEDALIQSLEELTSSTLKLQNIKVDLDNLISHKNIK